MFSTAKCRSARLRRKVYFRQIMSMTLTFERMILTTSPCLVHGPCDKFQIKMHPRRNAYWTIPHYTVYDLDLSTSTYNQFISAPTDQLHSSWLNCHKWFIVLLNFQHTLTHARRTRKRNAPSTVLTVTEA